MAKRTKRPKLYARDRISRLPEPIMQHVLFFLPLKDAGRTSILSRTWLSAWKSLPVFEFPSYDHDPLSSAKSQVKLCNSVDLVDEKSFDAIDDSLSTLRKHKVRIHRFELNLSVSHIKCASRIDQWIELATRNYIRELVLGLISCFQTYTLPMTTFASNSYFSILKLSFCEWPSTMYNGNTKFTCLRELSLVYVKIEELTVQRLLSNCALLEKFRFRQCYGVKHLQLRHLPRLEEVILEEVPKIEIEEPNIRQLKCENHSHQPLELRLVGCNLLRELRISAYFTTEFIQELVANLPHLYQLHLNNYGGMKRLKICSQRLRIFVFESYKFDEHLTEVEIDASNLWSYVYSSAKAIPSSVSINSPTLQRARLVVQERKILDTQWFINLMKYHGNFINENALTFRVCSDVNESVLEQLRDRSALPPAHIHRLELQHSLSKFNYAALLDSFFWIFHPDTIAITPINDSSNEFLEFVRDKLMINREKNPQCCNNCHKKCWRHYLMDARIVVDVTVPSYLSTSEYWPSLFNLQLKWSYSSPVKETAKRIRKKTKK